MQNDNAIDLRSSQLFLLSAEKVEREMQSGNRKTAGRMKDDVSKNTLRKVKVWSSWVHRTNGYTLKRVEVMMQTCKGDDEWRIEGHTTCRLRGLRQFVAKRSGATEGKQRKEEDGGLEAETGSLAGEFKVDELSRDEKRKLKKTGSGVCTNKKKWWTRSLSGLHL